MRGPVFARNNFDAWLGQIIRRATDLDVQGFVYIILVSFGPQVSEP